MEMDNKLCAYWLSCLKTQTGASIRRLLAEYGSPGEVFCAGEVQLKQLLTQVQREEFLRSRKKYDNPGMLAEEYKEMERRGIHYVCRGEKEYPERLSRIPDAPLGLFYAGELPAEDRPAVAVVGARDCSAYGGYVAEQIGMFLGQRRVNVISGMARGVDGISQQKALQAGGCSYAVLGCGVDICYPASNQPIYDSLLEKGGVISTYPPGTPPLPRQFPARNRIVSGLADALIVVEARHKSGTLITVDMALEQGREVYVVPGRITDRLSDGCNRLIKQGAGIFLSPEAFLEELYGYTQRVLLQEERLPDTDFEEKQKVVERLPERMRLVYRQLDRTPKNVAEIMAEVTNPDWSSMSEILMELCLKGLARQVSAGYFSLA